MAVHYLFRAKIEAKAKVKAKVKNNIRFLGKGKEIKA
jgi:hypothetical protein